VMGEGGGVEEWGSKGEEWGSRSIKAKKKAKDEECSIGKIEGKEAEMREWGREGKWGVVGRWKSRDIM